MAVPAAASANCTLSLVLVPCIEVTVPAAHALGDLTPPTTATSAEQAVVVSSNQPWGLRVRADAADGRMAEWDGAAYTPAGKVMTSALHWSLTSVNGGAQAANYAALTGSDASVVSGRAATGCVLGGLCGTSSIGVRYRQAVSFSDRRAAPRVYRIRVTYTASHGW